MLLPALIAGAIGIVCALILIGYLIAAAFNAADDPADEDTDGDPDFTGATWNREDRTAWGDVPALPENNLLHSAPLADGVQRDHV